jgi:hypothetical protein
MTDFSIYYTILSDEYVIAQTIIALSEYDFQYHLTLVDKVNFIL